MTTNPSSEALCSGTCLTFDNRRLIVLYSFRGIIAALAVWVCAAAYRETIFKNLVIATPGTFILLTIGFVVGLQGRALFTVPSQPRTVRAEQTGTQQLPAQGTYENVATTTVDASFTDDHKEKENVVAEQHLDERSMNLTTEQLDCGCQVVLANPVPFTNPASFTNGISDSNERLKHSQVLRCQIPGSGHTVSTAVPSGSGTPQVLPAKPRNSSAILATIATASAPATEAPTITAPLAPVKTGPASTPRWDATPQLDTDKILTHTSQRNLMLLSPLSPSKTMNPPACPPPPSPAFRHTLSMEPFPADIALEQQYVQLCQDGPKNVGPLSPNVNLIDKECSYEQVFTLPYSLSRRASSPYDTTIRRPWFAQENTALENNSSAALRSAERDPSESTKMLLQSFPTDLLREGFAQQYGTLSMSLEEHLQEAQTNGTGRNLGFSYQHSRSSAEIAPEIVSFKTIDTRSQESFNPSTQNENHDAIISRVDGIIRGLRFPETADRAAASALQIPVTNLMLYFGALESNLSTKQQAATDLYRIILSRAHTLPPETAADLLRLPVKINVPNAAVTSALCRRLLQFQPPIRGLKTMQLALICWSLAKTPRNSLPYQLMHDMVSSAAEEAVQKIAAFQPLSIANMLWACGKLRRRDLMDLINALATAAVKQLIYLNPQNVANAFWAIGTLEAPHTALTPPIDSPKAAEIVKHVLPKLSEFNSQALANLIWACAKVGWRKVDLMEALAQEADRKSAQFKSQETSNVMWGLAKLGLYQTAPTLRRFARHAALHLPYLNCQEVANAYWAIGTLDVRDSALTPMKMQQQIPNPHSEALLDPVNSFPTDDERVLLQTLNAKILLFNAQAVANFFWACGKLQWRQPELLPAIETVVYRNISQFRPQNIANVFWALAKLRFKDSKLIDLLSRTAASRLGEFNTQETANMYWALGTLECRDTALTPYPVESPFNSKANAVTGPVRAILPKLDRFRPQEIANFVWACARLRWRVPCLLERICEVASQKQSGSFKPQEIGNLLWALAKLHYNKDQKLIDLLCERFCKELKGFTPQNISNVFWALATFNCEDIQSYFERCGADMTCFVATLRAALENFNEQELSHIIWALDKLQWVPSELEEPLRQCILKKLPRLRGQDIVNIRSILKSLFATRVAVRSVFRRRHFERHEEITEKVAQLILVSGDSAESETTDSKNSRSTASLRSSH